METQATYTNDPCPKGIVNQLLEIAKENDAMSEIGGATGWRWQEGIISRMPKTKTVARILKKAYGTDDASEWLKHVSGDLKAFVKNAFGVYSGLVSNYNPKDIYEAVFILSTHDGRGATFCELVFKLAYVNYCKSNDFSDEHFIEIDENLILKINERWATEKAKYLIDKFDIPEDENGFFLNPGYHNFTGQLNQYTQELTKLRLNAVGGNSNFDMWRTTFAGLSDEEMIEVEYKVIEYQKELLREIEERQKRKFRDPALQKTRVFKMTCVSIPNQPGESLKWKK